MKIPVELKLMDVRCRAKNSKGRECGRYLGRFQVEGTNRYADFVCPSCKALNQLHIDGVGMLHRDELKKSVKQTAPFEAAFIGG